MVDWNNVGTFDRYPNIADDMKEVGNVKEITFMDDGIDVNADLIQSSLKQKDIKGIKARDSIVFRVQFDEKDYEMWLSATAYTNLRELKKIRDENKGTLVNAKVKIERVSKDDATQPAFSFERV